MISYNITRQLRKRRRRSVRMARREQLSHSHKDIDSESASDEEVDRIDVASNEETGHITTTDGLSMVSDYTSDDFDKNYVYSSDGFLDDSNIPLYRSSSVSVKMLIRRLAMFFLDHNLDKRTSTNLLGLLKDLLPQPNQVPKSWNRVMKLGDYATKSVSTFLCGRCHHE